MPRATPVDLSEFTAVAEGDEADAEGTVDADAAEAPAEEKKPARTRAAKKADAETEAGDAPAEAEAEEPKKPARKRAAKKADAE